MSKQWLTKEQIAEELDIPEFIVTLLDAEGEIRVGRTPSGTRRYDAESVAEYKKSKSLEDLEMHLG